jgi:alkanesulfonate monooxygenase SsuD/methylene tetrahydromethanopterin reductase-like flavin-dependent oxidoreductase (luciferase family)
VPLVERSVGRDTRTGPAAKSATTLDVICRGRTGLAVRLDPMDADAAVSAVEAIKICRTVLTDAHRFFGGRFYRVDVAINRPPPVQESLPVHAVAVGVEAPTEATVADLCDLVDAVVLDGDPKSTAIWASHLQDAARSAGRPRTVCSSSG